MAAESIIPQLVDKKGGSYYTIAPRLELGKINKWKKRMICYLTGMKPYYLKCIKEGLYQPKTAEGEIKPESHWTNDERRVVNQDQRLKSIIMSCLADDIMKSVISCETAKATWTDLVHSFKGPSDTKENKIMDLKLEYQSFRAKPSESLSQTYTRYKTLRNQLPNDGVTLPKHEINSSQPAQNSQNEQKIQKDYNTKYKKMKVKLSLLEASPSTSQSPNTFQSNNKGLVAETFNWDEEEVLDDKEITQVKVLIALADDELSVGKNHARNGEWINITTRKVNILLSIDGDVDWQTYLKYINIDLNLLKSRD
ncbi:hypothetical protein Tco_0429299 [Tanacetum coccineum]